MTSGGDDDGRASSYGTDFAGLFIVVHAERTGCAETLSFYRSMAALPGIEVLE